MRLRALEPSLLALSSCYAWHGYLTFLVPAQEELSFMTYWGSHTRATLATHPPVYTPIAGQGTEGRRVSRVGAVNWVDERLITALAHTSPGS